MSTSSEPRVTYLTPAAADAPTPTDRPPADRPWRSLLADLPVGAATVSPLRPEPTRPHIEAPEGYRSAVRGDCLMLTSAAAIVMLSLLPRADVPALHARMDADAAMQAAPVEFGPVRGTRYVGPTGHVYCLEHLGRSVQVVVGFRGDAFDMSSLAQQLAGLRYV